MGQFAKLTQYRIVLRRSTHSQFHVVVPKNRKNEAVSRRHFLFLLGINAVLLHPPIGWIFWRQRHLGPVPYKLHQPTPMEVQSLCGVREAGGRRGGELLRRIGEVVNFVIVAGWPNGGRVDSPRGEKYFGLSLFFREWDGMYLLLLDCFYKGFETFSRTLFGI